MAQENELHASLKSSQWSVETILKIVAVLGAASLLIGITYNIAFFIGSKSYWLFYLSIADNVTATMYALPYALLMAVGYGVGAFTSSRRRRSLRAHIQSVTMPLVSAVVVVLLPRALGIDLAAVLGGAPSPPWYTGIIGLVCGLILISSSILGGAALAGHLSVGGVESNSDGATTPMLALSLSIVLLVCSILLGPIMQARVEREAIDYRPKNVYVETALSKAIISGSMVRLLDGGIILAQGKRWLWIPKAEIKLIVEQDPPR